MAFDVDAPVCRTCAVQQPPGAVPPRCAICDDERQWVPVGGQRWTSLAELRAEGHRSDIRDLEPCMTGIGVTPKLGIGQRALLVQTDAGNVLWDCVGYLDDDAIAAVELRGGLSAIAVSHPHFHGAMVEWSHAFDDAPLLLPTADREWVLRDDTTIEWWEDEVSPLPGIHLVRCGGHFDGSAVLFVEQAAEGRGAVLVGDTATVVADRNVSFMRSYPNLLPLPAATVIQVAERVTRYPFARVYGGWWNAVIDADTGVIRRSAERYVRWVQGS